MESHDHPTGTLPPDQQHQYGPRYGPYAAPAEPERPKWSARATGWVTAVAAAVVLGIGGVAVAHSGSEGAAAGAAQGGPGGAGGFPGRGGTGQAGLTGALHGTFVTRNPDGTVVTLVMQTGEVTAVSSTSLAVRSADGYAATYTVSADTTVNGGQSQVGAVRTGHTVTVVASQAGAATTVTDQSLATTGQQGQPPGQGTVPGAGTGTGIGGGST